MGPGTMLADSAESCRCPPFPAASRARSGLQGGPDDLSRNVYLHGEDFQSEQAWRKHRPVEGRSEVICLGKFSNKAQLVAARIDIRLPKVARSSIPPLRRRTNAAAHPSASVAASVVQFYSALDTVRWFAADRPQSQNLPTSAGDSKS